MGPTVTAILRRILWAGLVAGIIAGSAITVVQRLQIAPLIFTAEVFEEAATQAHSPGGTAADHHHDGNAADHHNGAAEEGWSPEDGLERTAFTWLANVLTGVGFGLILAAAVALAGRPIDRRRGLIWGLAGYGVFSVAPALGLPPELPGMMAADLVARQVWWLTTAGATAAALALIVFAPDRSYKRALQAAGLLLILLPHLLGAPHLAADSGSVPAELAARFVVASLAAAALFWVILGGLVGHFMAPLLPAAAGASHKPLLA